MDPSLRSPRIASSSICYGPFLSVRYISSIHRIDASRRYIESIYASTSAGEACVEGLEVRPATGGDQDGIHALANAYGNLGHWPERPDYLDHELATGTLVVATSRGDVV